MSDIWQWLLTASVLLWALGYLSWWAYRGLYPGSVGNRAGGCGGCRGCGSGQVPVALVPLKRNEDL